MFLFVEIIGKVFPGRRRTKVLSRFIMIGVCLLPLVCVRLSVYYHAYTRFGGMY